MFNQINFSMFSRRKSSPLCRKINGILAWDKLANERALASENLSDTNPRY
jgi:hypothetical protein